MSDCIDILRSIGATCASLNQVGGVDKRVWVTQLNQIESYTFDSYGYINSLVTKEIGTTNYQYQLAKIVGKKNTHSGTYEGVVGDNVNILKQTAILKIYTDSPSDRDKVIDLFDARELVVFFENANGFIEVYGLDKGLDGSALSGGTGVALQDDTVVTVTLSGDQNKLPYYFLHGGSLATSIDYLDNIGFSPIYLIQSYTAGTSTIDFTNNGGDDWNIDFKITPDTVQSTANIVGYQIYIEHWVAGVKNGLDTGFKTNDYSYNAVGNGAGVYLITQIYVLDDSSFFFVNSLILVDGSGTILYSIQCNGITINSVSGLNVNATANIVQTGVTYPIGWVSFTEFPPTNPLTILGSGATFNASIPFDSIGFGFSVDLGTEFTDDFPSPNKIGPGLTITIN